MSKMLNAVQSCHRPNEYAWASAEITSGEAEQLSDGEDGGDIFA